MWEGEPQIYDTTVYGTLEVFNNFPVSIILGQTS